MAAERGGNCELTEAGQTVVKHGVTIIGAVNIPASVPTDSSALYARNLLDFLKLVTDKDGAFHLNLEDEIVRACMVAHAGAVTRA
jgi:NAD(P) transhydrogenase subunit alpha